MPIFEYVCRECGHRFEAIVRGAHGGGEGPECPTCRSVKLEKQLSVFAVSGRGVGFDGEARGACGTCGDPRGPGSCSMN